jgi:hypothetical protein
MANWQVRTQSVLDPNGKDVYAQVNSVAISNVPISGGGKTVVASTYYYEGQTLPKVGTYAYDANGNVLWQDTKQLMINPLTQTIDDNGIYWVAISRDAKWAASGGGQHSENPDPIKNPQWPGAWDMCTDMT